MSKLIDSFMTRLAIPVIIAAGVLLIFVMLTDNQNTNTQSNGYLRVINCIVSHSPSSRTQQNIEDCYVDVEGDLNIKLKRYDSSIEE